MSLIDKYIKGIRFLLPTPFTIAILLTLFTFLLSYFWPNVAINEDLKSTDKITFILKAWNEGLWDAKGLAFTFQMMLMLLLGHVLAISNPVNNFINKLLPLCNSNARSAFIVTFFTLILSWFNWGLGLVFGAIFCKRIIENSSKFSIGLNAGLIGAAGYSGLMIWHGGISGSALVKISELGHLMDLAPKSVKSNVPSLLDFSKTVFSRMNLVVTFTLLTVLPISMYFLGKNTKVVVPKKFSEVKNEKHKTNLIGLEILDHSKYFGGFIGLLILLFCFYLAFSHPSTSSFQFINPNFLNLSLLSMALIFHQSFSNFINAAEKAIGGTVGILIQFPLYFGIMGVVSQTGIINDLAMYFQNISNDFTYPLFTFFSAGMINFLVPSGGGQWYVQGPLIIQSALEMGVSLEKSIIAMAYGDQLTNMMQPFWALPLLGITGLKAKDILPFTLILMIVGFMVFSFALIIF